MDLATFVFKSKVTQVRMARDLSVSVSHLNSVIRKRTKPSSELCIAIQQYTRGFVTIAELMKGWEHLDNPTKPDALEIFFRENCVA